MFKKRILLLFFLYFFLFLVIYLAFSEFYINNIFFLEKNENVEAKKSYYKLEPMVIYGIPVKNKLTYIQIQISLVYLFQDYNVEKEIIFKRNQIKKFLHTYLSNKSYYQIDKAYKREKIKADILNGINNILAEPINDIYYSNFFVMKVSN